MYLGVFRVDFDLRLLVVMREYLLWVILGWSCLLAAEVGLVRFEVIWRPSMRALGVSACIDGLC